MTVKKNFVPAMRNVMFAATAIFALARCNDEEQLVRPEAAPVETMDMKTVADAALSISSMTISGVNTSFATAEDCKTCTFVVPEGTTLVDGKELGFEPGNVICLNTAFKYGELEFTNIEGTPEKPIVITTVGAEKQSSETSSSENGNPY